MRDQSKKNNVANQITEVPILSRIIPGMKTCNVRPMSENEQLVARLIEEFAVFDSDALLSEHKEDLVCFCDPKTKRITEFFTKNEEMSFSLEKDIRAGKSCFETLKGRNRPCTFCAEELLAKDRFYVWPFQDILSENTYIHKSRTIVRGGKSVRMEILQDVTEPSRKEAMLIQALKSMRLWAECSRLMSSNYPFEDAVKYLLEEMGTYLNAQCAYLVLFGHEDFHAVWPHENAVSFPSFFKNPSREAIAVWQRELQERAHVHIRDTSSEDLPQAARDYWKKEGRESALFYPLFNENELIGVLCLYNISMNSLQSGMVDLVVESIVETYQRYVLNKHEQIMKYHDSQSRALNMEGFKHSAQYVIGQNPNKRYAFWYCDIRNFRFINDLFGSEVGQKFVCYWVDHANSTLPDKDTFGRIAVDSLIALQCYEDIGEIEKRFHERVRILSEFPEFKLRGYQPELVCGIYLVPDEELANLDFNKMLNRASIAQKAARNDAGSQLAFYKDNLRKKQLRELEMRQGFEAGLMNKEFFIQLQPQYDYLENKLIGAEALVRWDHPLFGPLPPAEFIEVFEQSGQITDLDLFVCEEVCSLLQNLLKNPEYPLLPISINLSRLDVLRPNLCERLLGLANKYNIPVSMLRFEITEGAFVEGSEVIIDMVDTLRSQGFAVEMDDFGSGYSSLTTLKDVSVDVLKLDMGFLQEGYNQGRAGQILQSVIEMAHRIDLVTLAEGVETEEQARFLSNLKCTYMQGYYFSRPLSVDDFVKLLSKSAVKTFG